jgi:hypothetical protein
VPKVGYDVYVVEKAEVDVVVVVDDVVVSVSTIPHSSWPTFVVESSIDEDEFSSYHNIRNAVVVVGY